MIEMEGLCGPGKRDGLGKWRAREGGRGVGSEAVGRVFWECIGGYQRVWSALARTERRGEEMGGLEG